jgi:hypothetical protein
LNQETLGKIWGKSGLRGNNHPKSEFKNKNLDFIGNEHVGSKPRKGGGHWREDWVNEQNDRF